MAVKLRSFLYFDPSEMMRVDEKKKVGEMSPTELDAHNQLRSAGRQWHVDHPTNHANILDVYNKSTPEEKDLGENWYETAHHMVKSLSETTGTPPHTVAGLMSVYSPRNNWGTNMLIAAHVARTKKAVGGIGETELSGMGGRKASATGSMRRMAQRLLNGEHYNDVFKGPKTRDFAYLTEHGSHNDDPENPHVVIDRHAHSVASGARIPDHAFEVSGLDNPKQYNHVKSHYVKATKIINKRDGRSLLPGQIQATTWLTQQRLNQEGETKAASKSKGTASAGRAAMATWTDYAKVHHPELVGKVPPVGYTEE